MSDSKASDTPRRYGVVLFDDPENPGTGWASINGDASYQIRSMHDLPNDVIWITNLDFDNFRKSKVELNPWFRADSYLPVKIADVLAEWGLDPANTPLSATASFCSGVFQRIMGIAWKLIRECNPDADRNKVFTAGSLRDDLRHLIPRLDFPSEEAWHVLQPKQAYKEFTQTSIRSPRGAARVMLRRPRLAHALDVLTSPVPSGEFSLVGKNLMRGKGDRVNWIRDSQKPCLVNVTYLGLANGVSGDVQDIFAFGNAISNGPRINRTWLPHPEFMVMSTFSRLDVLGSWVGNDYYTMNNGLAEPVRQFLSNRYSEMSWSAGVVAEALLRAACMGPPFDRNMSAEERKVAPKISWQGAWLRAADRMQMFTGAMSLHKDGFSVQSYGLGWIVCTATEDQMQDLMYKSMSLGLLPRFFDIPDGMFRQGNVPWSGDKSSAALAIMTALKQKNRLWNIDRIPLYEKDRQEEMLRKIMEHNR